MVHQDIQDIVEEVTLESLLADSTVQPEQWLPGTLMYAEYLDHTENNSQVKRYPFPSLDKIQQDLATLGQLKMNEKGRYIVVPDDEIGFFDDAETDALAEDEALEMKINRANAYVDKIPHYFQYLAHILYQGNLPEHFDMEKFYNRILKETTGKEVEPNRQIQPKPGSRNKYVVKTCPIYDLSYGEIIVEEAEPEVSQIYEEAPQEQATPVDEAPQTQAPQYITPVFISSTPKEDPKASWGPLADAHGGDQDYEWLTQEIKRQKDLADAHGGNPTINLIEARLLKMMGDYDRNTFDFAGEPTDALDQMMRDGYHNQHFNWETLTQTADALRPAPEHVQDNTASVHETPVADTVGHTPSADVMETEEVILSPPPLPSLQQLLDQMNGKNPYMSSDSLAALNTAALNNVPNTIAVIEPEEEEEEQEEEEEITFQLDTADNYDDLYETAEQPAPAEQRAPVSRSRFGKLAVTLSLVAASLSLMKFSDNKKEMAPAAPVQAKIAAVIAPAASTVQKKNTVTIKAVKKAKKDIVAPVASTLAADTVTASVNADTAQIVSYGPTEADYMPMDTTAARQQEYMDTATIKSAPIQRIQLADIRTDLRAMTQDIKIHPPQSVDLHLPEIKNNFESHKKPGLFLRIFGGKKHKQQPEPVAL